MSKINQFGQQVLCVVFKCRKQERVKKSPTGKHFNWKHLVLYHATAYLCLFQAYSKSLYIGECFFLDLQRFLFSVPAVAQRQDDFMMLKRSWADNYYVQPSYVPFAANLTLESYKIDDTVLTVNANGQLMELSLPSAAFSDQCNSFASISTCN